MLREQSSKIDTAIGEESSADAGDPAGSRTIDKSTGNSWQRIAIDPYVRKRTPSVRGWMIRKQVVVRSIGGEEPSPDWGRITHPVDLVGAPRRLT
jgi:hypothetical protein